jgi:hypothetical protein
MILFAVYYCFIELALNFVIYLFHRILPSVSLDYKLRGFHIPFRGIFTNQKIKKIETVSETHLETIRGNCEILFY